MKYALISGILEPIENTERGSTAICPICGEEVISKRGNNKEYFSHKIGNGEECELKMKNYVHIQKESIINVDINEEIFTNNKNYEVEDSNGFTDEQLAVINCTEKRVMVNARSGSGKTSVMEEYIRRHESEKILYLVFNSSAANSARERFEDANNVEIRTIHSFAYQHFGIQYKNFLTNSINIFDVAKGIDKFIRKPSEFEYVENLLNHFETFLLSKYKTVKDYCKFYKLDSDFVKDIQKLCEKSKNKKMKITHSFYYKLWHLSNPEFRGYDTLLVDEVNDINEAFVDIIENNTYLDKIILSGDKFQSLYKFAKCVNAFELLDTSKWKEYKLTNSFRFGNTLADIIQQSFSSYFDDFKLTGLNKHQLVKKRIDLNKPYYMICRYNATIIKNTIESALEGKKIYIEWGKAGVSFSFIKHLYEFKYHNKQHHTLKKFEDFEHLERFAEKTNDYEIKFALKLINKYKEALLLNIRNAEENIVDDWRLADICYSTGHKIKGNSITIPLIISNDFPSIISMEESGKYSMDSILSECYLLYVVATRCKFDFELPPQLMELYNDNIVK